jgi:hypothetical protein
MKRYKLLKDLPWIKAGVIFEEQKYSGQITIINKEYNYLFRETEILPDWFEEIQEDKFNKYRVIKEIYQLYEVWDIVDDRWYYYFDKDWHYKPWQVEFTRELYFIFEIISEDKLKEYFLKIN